MTSVTVTTPTTPLVVHGAKASGSPSLTRDGLTVPQPTLVASYVPPSPWVDGEDPNAVRTPNAVLGMKVRVEGATEADHDLIVTLWRVALRQLDYQVTVTVGNRSTTWAARPGTITLANSQREPLITGQPVIDRYLITIPVHPDPLLVA